MGNLPRISPVHCEGRVLANEPVSSGLIRLDLELEHPVSFLPGQFAMLNLSGEDSLVFSRPFSIFATAGPVMSFLYRVVGRGTRAMGGLAPGAPLSFLGPLGTPFPRLDSDGPVVLIAGGVGLPPLAAWLSAHAEGNGSRVRAFFGARDGADVPWDILGDRWQVSVEAMRDVPADREARPGLVTELVAATGDLMEGPGCTVLSCGPTPLLKAARRLATERGWSCWLSLEEHMGCGYGVCKGCVVPVHDPRRGPEAVRNATCCEEGPVFNADLLAWD